MCELICFHFLSKVAFLSDGSETVQVQYYGMSFLQSGILDKVMMASRGTYADIGTKFWFISGSITIKLKLTWINIFKKKFKQTFKQHIL